VSAREDYVKNQGSHKVEVCQHPTKSNPFDSKLEVSHKEIVDGYVKENRKTCTKSERESNGLGSEVNSQRV